MGIRVADDATRWATTSNQSYPGLCDHFVGLAYGLPHSGYASARVHWDSTPAALRSNDTSPPVGALVFWDTGKPAGHVAIVTGHDRSGNSLVTTTHTNGGRPTTMTLASINKGMSYLGWSKPYFNGQTTDLDKESTGIYSQPDTRTAPTDKSGVDTSNESDIALRGAQYAAGIAPDKLSWKELGKEYGYARSLLKSVPELRDLFKQAANEDWSDPAIIGQIKSTKWYHDNSEYARNTILQQATGGADWEEIQQTARTQVEAMITSTGSALTPDAKEAMVSRYLMEGWGKRAGGDQMMKTALAESISLSATADSSGWFKGEAGDLQQALAAVAADNGLTLSSGYYESAAKSVAKGLRTAKDWERDVRTQAASLWPTYSEQIMSGVNVRDLASGYVKTMADVLEVDQDMIKLDDPILRQSLTRVDDKGQVNPVGLYDFANELRKRPEWLNTKNAQDKMASIAGDVARTFGFTG